MRESWCNVEGGPLQHESSLCEKDPAVSASSVSQPTLGDLKEFQRNVLENEQNIKSANSFSLVNLHSQLFSTIMHLQFLTGLP